jgi:hypothetical protein
MISDTLFTATFDVSDAKETAQRAIGSALRISTEEVTREHLPVPAQKSNRSENRFADEDRLLPFF